MQDWRTITHKAMNLLIVCLANGIDQALTARRGEQWFAEFQEEDAKEKIGNRITKPGQQSVLNLDLQALLKILRFRSSVTMDVLQHYRFLSTDSFEADDQLRQLNLLLDRLIYDFRNRLEAHTQAGEIEKELTGKKSNRLYSYKEAYHDMCKLAEIFATVKDVNGDSYHRRMVDLSRKWVPWVAGIIGTLVAVVGVLVWLLVGNPGNVYEDTRAPIVQQAELTVQPYRVYYKGGELFAECYIINGTSKPIPAGHEISLQLTVDGRDLAAASFAVLEKNLAPGQSVLWCFRFPAEQVQATNAKLTDVRAKLITE